MLELRQRYNTRFSGVDDDVLAHAGFNLRTRLKIKTIKSGQCYHNKTAPCNSSAHFSKNIAGGGVSSYVDSGCDN